MRSIQKVGDHAPVTFLFREFSDQKRRFPKNLVVGFATLSSIALISHSGPISQEHSSKVDIFPTITTNKATPCPT